MLGALVMAPSLALAQGLVPQVRVTPPSTTVPACDEAANAWRACINASPKTPQERAAGLAEVDRFVRDVFDSRDGGRRSLSSACPGMAQGYGEMLRSGACARNVTGAFDDTPRRGGVEQQRRP
ncbi:hypothetical protein ACI6QG_06770 [Roseococcus sp. DSY-14]